MPILEIHERCRRSVLLEFLKPGDLLLYSSPTNGATDHFIHHYLKDRGVHSIGFTADMEMEDIKEEIVRSGHADKLSLIYLETPANPTNALIDIEMASEIAKHFSTSQKKVHLAVDNTYMGPIWSQPLKHGADMVIYSATKYIGGHSDLIAGAVLGHYDVIKRVKTLRTFLGNMAGCC